MIPIFIPARGNSKRIPRKNLQPYRDTTLLGWGIRNASRVGPVYVSTDCAEIASNARESGATVIDRPADIADDYTHAFEALKHALPLMGIEKYVGMLNITCPEPGWPQIIEALPALMKRNRIAAFTAYPFRGFIYSRKGPVLESHNRAWNQRPRSQDQQTYRESGAFYFFRADHVMLMPDQIIPQSQIIEVPETPEIDYPEDLERCRILSQK